MDSVEGDLVDVPGVFVEEVLGPVLLLPRMVEVGCFVGYQSRRHFACDLLCLGKHWRDIIVAFVLGHHLCYPVTGFRVEHREQIPAVALDTHVDFVGSPSLADLRAYPVGVGLHELGVVLGPVVDGDVADLHVDLLQEGGGLAG